MKQEVAVVVIWAIFGLSWLFVAQHTVLSAIESRRFGRTPWWRTAMGWLLTLAVASLGTVFAFLVAAQQWPVLATFGWFQWAYLLSFGGIVAVLVGKNVARIWLHVRARRDAE